MIPRLLPGSAGQAIYILIRGRDDVEMQKRFRSLADSLSTRIWTGCVFAQSAAIVQFHDSDWIGRAFRISPEVSLGSGEISLENLPDVFETRYHKYKKRLEGSLRKGYEFSNSRHEVK